MITIRTVLYLKSKCLFQGLLHSVYRNEYIYVKWSNKHKIYNEPYFVQNRTFQSSIDCKQSVPSSKHSDDGNEEVLLHTSNGVKKVKLTTARLMAKNQGLILKKKPDSVGENVCATYKLISASEACQDDTAKNDSTTESSKVEKVKNQKVFYMSSNIQKHDLSIKINKINKLLQKGHEVKVIIDDKEGETDVVKEAKSGILYGKVSQAKGYLNIIPNKQQSEQSNQIKQGVEHL